MLLQSWRSLFVGARSCGLALVNSKIPVLRHEDIALVYSRRALLLNHLLEARAPSIPPTGQDGSYLAEFLLQKGYVVYGLMRRSSSFNTGRIEHLYKDKHQRAVRCVASHSRFRHARLHAMALCNVAQLDA